MARTEVRGGQVKDATIQRDDLDITTSGQAVTRKLIQGTGIILSSTGADAGTGDVTVNAGGRIIAFEIDGGGNVIGTGAKKAYLTVPLTCTITKWRIIADVSTTAVLDIWKDTYANFPPVNGDSITASAKPTVTAATNAESTSVGTWTGAGALTLGDVLEVEVESNNNATKLRLELFVS